VRRCWRTDVPYSKPAPPPHFPPLLTFGFDGEVM
jgi:hypothetical protein